MRGPLSWVTSCVVFLLACSGSDTTAVTPPAVDAGDDVSTTIDAPDVVDAPDTPDAPDVRTGCAADNDCASDGGASRCDTSTGRCVECVSDPHCAAGTLCVGNVCVAGCSATQPCGAGQLCCAGGCGDAQTNLSHCGACDRRCEAANATAACMNGACAVAACVTGFGDCDADASNGCEVELRSSTAHCGACGNACAARPRSVARCTAGACEYACEPGFADCDGDVSNGCETDTRASANHCGMCGRACDLANATSACSMGSCVVAACAEGFGDCDGNGANGCEADTRTSTSHCGMCGRACPSQPNAAPACVAGSCGLTCLAGFADCNGGDDGCETDTRVSATHCGACGRGCTVPGGVGACVASACTVDRCDAGRADCDGDLTTGCETMTDANPRHCGGCGVVCPSGVCAGGACQPARCDDGLFNGSETDLDCGGSCPGCALGRNCSGDADCLSGECRAGVCVDIDGSSCTGAPVLGPRSGFMSVRAHATGAAMRGVGSMVGDGAGVIYAHDPYGNGTSGDRVLRVAADGAVTTFAAPAGFSTCTSQQVARTAAGDVVIWDISSNALLRINPAGMVSTLSTVGGIGGGGSCTDSGIQGLFALPGGGFVATSPLRSAVLFLDAGGNESSRVSGVATAFRVAADGSSAGVLVTSAGRILRVSGGSTATVYGGALVGGAGSVRRDGDGVVVFSVGTMVFAVEPDGTGLRVVLGCAGSSVTDVLYERASAGAGTSLYVSTLGATIGANDGDTIWELRR